MVRRTTFGGLWITKEKCWKPMLQSDNRKAALKFLRKLMKRYGTPKVIVTDWLHSYGAAMKVVGNANRQKVSRWKNNRAENSYLPFRRRERAMLRFWRIRSLQKFAAVHSSIHNHFNQERHLYSRQKFKLNRIAALSLSGGSFVSANFLWISIN